MAACLGGSSSTDTDPMLGTEDPRMRRPPALSPGSWSCQVGDWGSSRCSSGRAEHPRRVPFPQALPPPCLHYCSHQGQSLCGKESQRTFWKADGRSRGLGVCCPRNSLGPYPQEARVGPGFCGRMPGLAHLVHLSGSPQLPRGPRGHGGVGRGCPASLSLL